MSSSLDGSLLVWVRAIANVTLHHYSSPHTIACAIMLPQRVSLQDTEHFEVAGSFWLGR
jgi:hypothetical protein